MIVVPAAPITWSAPAVSHSPMQARRPSRTTMSPLPMTRSSSAVMMRAPVKATLPRAMWRGSSRSIGVSTVSPVVGSCM